MACAELRKARRHRGTFLSSASPRSSRKFIVPAKANASPLPLKRRAEAPPVTSATSPTAWPTPTTPRSRLKKISRKHPRRFPRHRRTAEGRASQEIRLRPPPPPRHRGKNRGSARLRRQNCRRTQGLPRGAFVNLIRAPSLAHSRLAEVAHTLESLHSPVLRSGDVACSIIWPGPVARTLTRQSPLNAFRSVA